MSVIKQQFLKFKSYKSSISSISSTLYFEDFGGCMVGWLLCCGASAGVGNGMRRHGVKRSVAE